MTKYDVIVKDTKSGTKRKIGELIAENQIDAKKQAVQKYFTQINMIIEHLMVVRSKIKSLK